MIFSKKVPINIELEITPNAIIRAAEISERFSDTPIFELNIGIHDYYNSPVKDKSIINDVCKKGRPLVIIDTCCEYYRSLNHRVANVRVIFYTMTKLCKYERFVIQVYCKGRVLTSQYDDMMIGACIDYARILFEENRDKIDRISVYPVFIPQLDDMHNVKNIHYDGYLKTFSSSSTFGLCRVNSDEMSIASGINSVGFKDEDIESEEDSLNDAMIAKVIRTMNTNEKTVNL